MLDGVTGHADGVTRCPKKELAKLLFGTTAGQNPINWRDVSIILIFRRSTGNTDGIPFVVKDLTNGILNLLRSSVSRAAHTRETAQQSVWGKVICTKTKSKARVRRGSYLSNGLRCLMERSACSTVPHSTRSSFLPAIAPGRFRQLGRGSAEVSGVPLPIIPGEYALDGKVLIAQMPRFESVLLMALTI